LSLAVGEEVKSDIDVLSLTPGTVNTALTGFMKDNVKFDPTICEPI